jgi:hypothetical protein
MCEHGNTVDLEVTVPADLSHTGQDRWAVKPIDRCIAPIVQALNDGGVTTVSSCCGHGKRPGVIALADGRTLVVGAAPAGSATPTWDEHVTEYGRGFAVPGEPGADVITTLRPDVQVLADAMCRHSMTSQWKEKAREVLRTLSANGWRLSAPAGSATPTEEDDDD